MVPRAFPRPPKCPGNEVAVPPIPFIIQPSVRLIHPCALPSMALCYRILEGLSPYLQKTKRSQKRDMFKMSNPQISRGWGACPQTPLAYDCLHVPVQPPLQNALRGPRAAGGLSTATVRNLQLVYINRFFPDQYWCSCTVAVRLPLHGSVRIFFICLDLDFLVIFYGF